MGTLTPAGPLLADPLLADLPLVDQHCHGVVVRALDVASFAGYLTESPDPPAAGTSFLDSQLGYAVRRWCAPLLDLEPNAAPQAYLAQRTRLGATEVTRRMLRAAGIAHYLVDTGLGGDEVLTAAEIGQVAGAPAGEVVRLEAVAERVVSAGTTATGFAADLRAALEVAAGSALAVKTIVAYRHGLDFDPAPPSPTQVRDAAGEWLGRYERTGAVRLSDPVLLRHVLWAGIALGLPLQIHTGYGDPDLDLHRCDPALLTGFVRTVRPVGVDVVLLHCYPYLRQAGYLAAVFPHVYLDVGLTVNHVGARAGAVLAEALEVAPFGKVLFSTDAYGLAELYYLGAALFRLELGRLLRAWVADGAWTAADAERVARLIGADNARRVYGLAG